ncbi:MAG: ABC transporter substrate-binding protein [Rhodospirillaceae bacterium]|nr:ABC transporter substrate-binding protein [Rhodospirillaceae bacterium]
MESPSSVLTPTEPSANPTGLLSKKITIATEGAYPPFNYTDQNGQLIGFEIDLAKALCQKMNVECVMVGQDWDGLIPALQSGKFDAIMAGMSITPERKQQVDFSNKYINTPTRFVAKKGSDFTITAAGLAGKRVGAQRATIHEGFLRRLFPQATIVLYDTLENAHLDMVGGRLDLILADSVALNEGFLKTVAGQNYEFVGPSYTEPKDILGEGVGIAVRKGDISLLKAFNQAIAQVRADGTFKKINDRYFDFDVYGN